MSDIIDNRDTKLVDSINAILPTSASVDFAVGYLFLSGLGAIEATLDAPQQLRLLIGNATDRETIEHLAAAFHRAELVQAQQERERYLTRQQTRERAADTALQLREALSLMDQGDAEQAVVSKVMRLIVEGRLELRVYTRGRLHAKAYIFHYPDGERFENGMGIVGSSNLTLAGLTHNSELNVAVHGNENHAQLSAWFDRLWAESTDFSDALLTELRQCWAAAAVTPYDIYMKTLYELVSERMEGPADDGTLWDDELTQALAEFQKEAVKKGVQVIREYGGVFIADVVGLGKSYIGAAILKHFRRTEGCKPLIICPAPLKETWEEFSHQFDLGARVVTMSMLRGSRNVLTGKQYQDYDFVLIDESHHFRHHTSQQYAALQDFLLRRRSKLCLLTATPRNKSAWDVYNQIKLFHPDDITMLPIDPPNLKDYFKLVEKGSKTLQTLLKPVLVRRTRRHILRWYGIAEDSGRYLREMDDGQAAEYLNGRKRAYVMVGARQNYFPRRRLGTLAYNIDETYAGLYDHLRSRLGGRANGGVAEGHLNYARFGLWHYVLPGKRDVQPYQGLHRAGANLHGLMRVMLFKRLESSVYAFLKTLERMILIHDGFLQMLDQGIIPAGEDAQKILYESDAMDEEELIDALAGCCGKYKIEDFDADRLRRDIAADRNLLEQMRSEVAAITPDKDAKLQVLQEKLNTDIPKASGKVLVFTQFADTASYLHQNLNPGGADNRIDVIYGTEKSKARVAARFSPLSNPYIQLKSNEPEINLLIATDVMSEGLNLQDGDVIVNYDLHWNPVRLIQRFGRIDRIGTENSEVWGFNFLPERQLDQNLGLTATLRTRIQEIHDTIGEDAAILDQEERINEEAMFAIYENRDGQMLLAEEEEDGIPDLAEAEEFFRRLQTEDPEEYKRIAELRNGIRSARPVFSGTGTYVFCQAGKFQQLYLLDAKGETVSKDMEEVLRKIRCPREEPRNPLPATHNQTVMRVKAEFETDVRERTAQQEALLSLSAAQKYVIRELRAHEARTEDEDVRRRCLFLEEAFKQTLPAALRKNLNTMRRNGVTGDNLLRNLAESYQAFDLGSRARNDRIQIEQEVAAIPRIICSEALL